MQAIMNWFSNIGWEPLMGVFAAVVLVFDRLSKLFPTFSDNPIVKALQAIFSILGLRVKDNPGTLVVTPATPQPKIEEAKEAGADIVVKS